VERKRIVMLVTLSRVLAAPMLLLAGANHWWGQAAFLLAVGCAGNIADDRMANNWNVNTRASRRLRGNANTLLAFCALAAAIVGGIWPWQLMLLALLWAGIYWYERHLYGDWLAAARLLLPAGGVCLLAIAESSYLHHAWGISFALVLSAMLPVVATICYMERDRVRAFMHLALR